MNKETEVKPTKFRVALAITELRVYDVEAPDPQNASELVLLTGDIDMEPDIVKRLQTTIQYTRPI